MSKSVLGNDPFEGLGLEPTPPKKKKPAAKKKVAAKKKAAEKTEKKKASTKKPSAKKNTVKKTAVKKAAAPKTAKKKAVAKKSTPKKTSAKRKEIGSAGSEKAKGKKLKSKSSVKVSEKESSRRKAESLPVAEPTTNETPIPGKAIIGGQDAALMDLLRPNDFGAGQEFGMDPEFRKSLEPLTRFFYNHYWRVSVKGIENIPENGRAVLVANHAGILPFDGMMVANAVRRETERDLFPLIENAFYHAPILGTVLSRLGFVRACQENAQRLLAEERMVLVFPEGIKGVVKPYSKRYSLQRFGRGGFVKLCLVTDSPVVPVAIVGSEEVHPMISNMSGLAKTLGLPFLPVTPLFPWLGPLGLVPLPAKWTIVFGEPVYINQFGPEASQDRLVLNRLSSQVKSQIQKIIDLEIGQRRSRWR